MNALAKKSESIEVWTNRIQPAYINDLPTFLDEDGDVIEGIYAGVPNDVYHALPAYSSTLIKELVKTTPQHAFRKFFSNVERKRTSAQRNTLDTGTLGHELILEPEHFSSRYFRVPLAKEHPNALTTIKQLQDTLKDAGLKITGTKPELVERVKEQLPNTPVLDVIIEEAYVSAVGQTAYDKAKELVAEKKASNIYEAFSDGLLTEYTSKLPMDGLVWDDAHRVQETFLTHERAKKLINNGYAELTVIARDPETGLMLKVKFDYINKNAIASDVKTTRSANPHKFRLQCRDLAYDVQEAFYKYVANLQGIPVSIFAFIAVEYLEADICEVYELSSNVQARAKVKMLKAVKCLENCLSKNSWHGYSKNKEVMVLDW